MTDQEAQTAKQQCLQDLRTALADPHYTDRLAAIDARLLDYFQDCTRTDIDACNLYELLALRKFLRMTDTYTLDTGTVQRLYRAYETLRFNGLHGRQQYTLTPMQTFQLAAPFLFLKDAQTGKRVCAEANYFIPRKASKTTLAAFFIFWFFFFEDANTECYCVANAQEQSKILFNLAKDLITQFDPTGKRIRATQTEITWQDRSIRQSKVQALSAGGKTKDGLFAGLVCADEYGSAAYTRKHSDMANLLNVVEGSMGPRLNPLTVITTTAGRVQEGPYQIKLNGIQEMLLQELQHPLDHQPRPLPTDWNFALICQPDQWEKDDEHLSQPYLWRKVNRHIGITVREDYYENEWQKMQLDPEKKAEQITKLFNIWQNGRVTDWLSASLIQSLQIPVSIDQINSEDGWVCFIGGDFSKGDDLNALSYLCYNTQTGQFFADMDAWINGQTLLDNPNRALYRLWYEQQHLHVCPGKTIDEKAVTARIMQVADHLTILRIGYDAYDAKRFINDLSAWIFSTGADPDRFLRPVSQHFATYNGVVQEMTYMVKNDPPLIHFSANPMWAWQFGNCTLMESSDGMENVKPVKASYNAKVDNVQALLSALHLYDEIQGTIN